MVACISDVRRWMLLNHLMINDSKTEVMLIGTWQQLAKIALDGIKVGNDTITPVTCVKNLGVDQGQNQPISWNTQSLIGAIKGVRMSSDEQKSHVDWSVWHCNPSALDYTLWVWWHELRLASFSGSTPNCCNAIQWYRFLQQRQLKVMSICPCYLYKWSKHGYGQIYSISNSFLLWLSDGIESIIIFPTHT